ncbi:glycosyltransferase [Longitalea arenae]|uniref:glycosyltransferase n=1 Tax=Longitalea arenae TaxID=2812558 RepID=UPI001967F299
MEKHLHIISFDVPYPVDHGGYFDLFYKLVALYQQGIRIHLHCFEHKRPQQPELEQYCAEVRYYPRQCGHKGFSHKLPYIVASRTNAQLEERLLKDSYPILLEGVHCTYLLHDERFNNRKIILRLHNVEYKYYKQLFHASHSLFKKMYYLNESRLLKQYEKAIANKGLVLAVSDQDTNVYRKEFGAEKVATLPVFLPYTQVSAPEGVGCFCLYHGNLSVIENERAAIWLMEKVFNDLKVPLVIAGKAPSQRLQRIANNHRNTCLVADPSEQEMQDMIGKAQINILPSFNVTGVKLKLLNALFNGRHCLVNEATVQSTGLEPACHIGANANAFKSLVVQLYRQPFAEEEIRLRNTLLLSTFDNKRNAQRLIQWIF